MTNQTEALAELIALDDLKRSLAQASHHAQMHPSDENYAVIDAIQTDLHRRQKPAWDAARAALSSQHPAPEEAAALPAKELVTEEGWLPVKDGVAGGSFVAYADWNMRPGLASGWKWAKVRRVTSIAWETATLAQGTTHVAQENQSWQPIETAPDTRECFVVRGFSVQPTPTSMACYTTDPYCVWRGGDGGFVRWPHDFPPTHWMSLQPEPASVTGTAQEKK